MKRPSRLEISWRLTADEYDDLVVRWSAWLDSITRGYFGDQSTSSLYQSATLSGVTNAAATLTAAAVTNRAPRRSTRCVRSTEPTSPGARASVHDVMAESLGNAAIDMGRNFCRSLDHVSPIIATDAVSRALLDALVDYLSNEESGQATMTTVMDAYVDALRSQVPTLWG